MSTSVSRVLSTQNRVLLQQNGKLEVQKFECCLRKSRKGGKPLPGGAKECYGKTVRVPSLCDVD